MMSEHRMIKASARFRFCLGCLVAVLTLIGSHWTAAADMRQPPGSRVKMDVPGNFETSKLFSGFVLPVARTSIVIAELPTNRLDQLKAGLTDAALAKKGIKDIIRAKLKRDDDHVYLVGKQTARGAVFNKYVLLIKDGKSVAVITFNVPEDAIKDGFVTQEIVEKVFTSASFTAKAAPIIKQFSLGYLGAFKEAGKLMGSAIMYSTDGQLVPKVKGIQRSVVIIAPSVDRVRVHDLKGFSERALKSVGGFTNVKLAETKGVTIAGLNGAKSEATAVSSSDKTFVSLVQVVLDRPKGGYYRLLAILRDSEKAKLMPDVEKLIASFKPVSG